MLYMIQYSDNPGTAGLRKEHQQDHIGFRRGLGDELKVAGPMFNEDDGPAAGSMIIVEADSMADAREKVAHDPYLVNGVFKIESVNRINPRTWKSVELG